MKTYLCIGVFLLAPIISYAAPDDRFFGGPGDGVDHSVFTSYTPPTGGQYGRFVSSGGYDGYGASTYVSYTPPSGGQYGRFVGGGGYDGYDSSDYSGYSPPVGGQHGRFVGGPYDGHAMIALHGISNPLAGDDDGDGVPDWWESFHYKSLTLADADTDIDEDGRGSYFEYVSDTDPNDKASLLRVISFDHEETVHYTFGTSSINRLYWIETSTTLQPGSWAPATSPRVIGTGGNMELSTPNIWTTDHFFRIGIAVE